MIRKLIVPLTLAAAVLGCRHAPRPMDVDLQWRATDDTSKLQSDIGRTLGGRRVQVANFTDIRNEKGRIGVNVQTPSKPVNVTAREDAGAWCAQQLKALLKRSGVDVVEGGAAYIVTGKVSELLVTEGEVYDGQATVLMTVSEAKGSSVWKGVAAGRAKRWGRTFSADNYMETLSDAYARALGSMFADEGFQAAVKQR